MGMIEDVMKALDRIPGWKRISDAPRQIDALEQRVAALEARLTPAAGDQCPRCREMAFRLIETVPADPPWNTLGVRVDVLVASISAASATSSRSRSGLIHGADMVMWPAGACDA